MRRHDVRLLLRQRATQEFAGRLVVAALLAHGVFDFIHAHLVPNPGVPAWWPGFCLTYDIAAAGYLAWILRSRLEARRNRVAGGAAAAV